VKILQYAKVDVGFHGHRKALEAGPLARDLYVAGLEYARRELTDGLILEKMVRFLAPDHPRPKQATKRLVDVGLWDTVEGGYRIHDYLDHNDAGSDVLASMEEKRAYHREYMRRKRATERGTVTPVNSSQPLNKVNGDAFTVKITDPPSVSVSVSKELQRQEDLCASADLALTHPPSSSNGHHPEPQKTIPALILRAIDSCPLFARAAALHDPVWWRSTELAYSAADHRDEIYKMGAWIAANPRKAPRKDLRRFVNAWLNKAHREAMEDA